MNRSASTSGSTFVIVLWIAFGLVSLTLYFANTMSLELRAADHRVCGAAAEQVVEGAIRYVAAVLGNVETNGVPPDPLTYLRESVPVGDPKVPGGEARFWLIGRDTNAVTSGRVVFGLVEESSKLNLNTASSNMLIWLPYMSEDLTLAILDWRDTNGGTGTYETYYGMMRPPYLNKSAPFETVEELRLLYGADRDLLIGEDLNRNGVLDPDEPELERNGLLDPGWLEYLTVYSREPNTWSNTLPRVNIRQATGLNTLLPTLQSLLGQSRATEVFNRLALSGGGGGGGRPGQPQVQATFRSPLEFYRRSGMTADEFELVEPVLTTTTNQWIEGRINVNTASAAVLACLPGLVDYPDLAETLVNYRSLHPNDLGSTAWVVEALGTSNASVLDALAREDCLTTRSYQYTADIAAVGPHGRGYRRTRVVFDVSDGTPRVVHRQDLTHLGWALGKETRQALLVTRNTR